MKLVVIIWIALIMLSPCVLNAQGNNPAKLFANGAYVTSTDITLDFTWNGAEPATSVELWGNADMKGLPGPAVPVWTKLGEGTIDPVSKRCIINFERTGWDEYWREFDESWYHVCEYKVLNSSTLPGVDPEPEGGYVLTNLNWMTAECWAYGFDDPWGWLAQ